LGALAIFTASFFLHLCGEFPTRVRYQRFVELMPTVLVPLVAYLHTQLGRWSGISFIDSTWLSLCRNPRIHQQRAFAGRIARGKTSVAFRKQVKWIAFLKISYHSANFVDNQLLVIIRHQHK
jgi:hypothetical protein